MNDVYMVLSKEAIASCVERFNTDTSSTAWAWEEKFAELIIKEVFSVMRKASMDGIYNYTYRGEDVPTCTHIMVIKKHFGIE